MKRCDGIWVGISMLEAKDAASLMPDRQQRLASTTQAVAAMISSSLKDAVDAQRHLGLVGFLMLIVCAGMTDWNDIFQEVMHPVRRRVE